MTGRQTTKTNSKALTRVMQAAPIHHTSIPYPAVVAAPLGASAFKFESCNSLRNKIAPSTGLELAPEGVD